MQRCPRREDIGQIGEQRAQIDLDAFDPDHAADPRVGDAAHDQLLRAPNVRFQAVPQIRALALVVGRLQHFQGVAHARERRADLVRDRLGRC